MGLIRKTWGISISNMNHERSAMDMDIFMEDKLLLWDYRSFILVHLGSANIFHRFGLIGVWLARFSVFGLGLGRGSVDVTGWGHHGSSSCGDVTTGSMELGLFI